MHFASSSEQGETSIDLSAKTCLAGQSPSLPFLMVSVSLPECALPFSSPIKLSLYDFPSSAHPAPGSSRSAVPTICNPPCVSPPRAPLFSPYPSQHMLLSLHKDGTHLYRFRQDLVMLTSAQRDSVQRACRTLRQKLRQRYLRGLFVVPSAVPLLLTNISLSSSRFVCGVNGPLSP